MSVKDLMDRMSHFRAKINTKLTGSETFSQWDTVLRRKVRGLGACPQALASKSYAQTSYYHLNVRISNAQSMLLAYLLYD
jgi:hypothetical protein